MLRNTAALSLALAAGVQGKATIATDYKAFIEETKKVPKEYHITITNEELEWTDVLGEGWTKMTGFMKEREYLMSLHKQDPPVPIVLGCDLDLKLNGTFDKLVLYTEGVAMPIGMLSGVEVYEHRKEERAARTFGMYHPELPYIANSIDSGKKSLCGGDLTLGQKQRLQKDGLDEFRLTPEQLKKEFKGKDAVFVFQLRNPIHNGHALLMQDTYRQLKEQGYKSPVLWINPLGGWTKDDDVPLDVRMRQHQALLKNKVFGDVPVILSIFPSPMLYAGPREVQWHALARQEVGATHYIVGRDPAGMKHPGTKEDLYSMWHGQTMLQLNDKIKMTLVPFQFAAYDKTVGKMAFFDPKRKDDFTSISGTKMRKLAADNEQPPDGFMDKDGWKILVEYYQKKAKAEL